MPPHTEALPKLSFTPGSALKQFALSVAIAPESLDTQWLNEMALAADRLAATTRSFAVRIVNRAGSGWIELPTASPFGLPGGVTTEVTLTVANDTIRHGDDVLWEAPPPPRVPGN